MTLLMVFFWVLGLITGWRLRTLMQQQREARETFERASDEKAS